MKKETQPSLDSGTLRACVEAVTYAAAEAAALDDERNLSDWVRLVRQNYPSEF